MKKCQNCGKEIVVGNRPDGLPNGVGFQKNGKIITLCTDCIIKLGALSDAEKEKFMKSLEKNHE